MTEHLISVKDFAERYGLIRQTVFKVLKLLEIEPSKSRGENQNRGQTISYITQDDARRILEALASSRSAQNGQRNPNLPKPLYRMSAFLFAEFRSGA